MVEDWGWPGVELAEPEMRVGKLALAAALGTTLQPCVASEGQCVDKGIADLLQSC